MNLNELNIIKIDAAQFFKAASLERRLSRVAGLLERVQNMSGLDAVAVRKTSGVDGHLCRSSKSSDGSFHVLSFVHILEALEFIRRDKYFAVGTTVVKRFGGWPMGGSFSEPGTLVDLNEELHVLHQRPERLSEVGWAYQRQRFPQSST